MLQYLKKKPKTNKFVKIERGEERTPHCLPCRKLLPKMAWRQRALGRISHTHFVFPQNVSTSKCL